MTLIILTHFSRNLAFIKMSLERDRHVFQQKMVLKMDPVKTAHFSSWLLSFTSIIMNQILSKTWLYCTTIHIKSDTYLAHL